MKPSSWLVVGLLAITTVHAVTLRAFNRRCYERPDRKEGAANCILRIHHPESFYGKDGN